MIIIASVIVLIVLVCIFLYFRLENVKQELTIARKGIKSAQKENKHLIDALVAVASRYEEFARYRLEQFKAQSEAPEFENNKVGLTIITPVINNYAHIFRECLKSEGRLATIVKGCYDHSSDATFEEFNIFIKRQDAAVKKMWQSNNLYGFVSMVEALLSKQAKLFDAAGNKPPGTIGNKAQQKSA